MSAAIPWMQLEVQARPDGSMGVLVVNATGESTTQPVELPGLSVEALQQYSAAIQARARAGEGLDRELRDWGQRLGELVFCAPVQAVAERLRAKGDGRLLVRFVVRNDRLKGVPWEAMEYPAGNGGALACDNRVRLVRDVQSSGHYDSREVGGALRVLAVATSEFAAELEGLRRQLDHLCQLGAVEWLPPLTGPDPLWGALEPGLRARSRVNVLHFIGHGAERDGVPRLLLSPSGEGEQWVDVENIANLLGDGRSEDLRLVYLQSCGGATPSVVGSAAEQFVRTGVQAVVAHLWPVDTLAASEVARAFYSALADGDAVGGDLASSLNRARRHASGELGTAEFLAPVLFLRGPDPTLFVYRRRRLVPRAEGAGGARADGLDPRLSALAADLYRELKSGATVVVGPGVDPEGVSTGQRDLAAGVQKLVPQHGGGLAGLMQRVEFRERRIGLLTQVGWALGTASQVGTTPPPILEGLTRARPDGLWVTLLWVPLVEEALARQYPNREVVVLQPIQPAGVSRMRVIRRRAGASKWVYDADEVLDRVDFAEQIVVLRVFGGLSAGTWTMFGEPVLTEDDQFAGLRELEALPAQILSRLSERPWVACGIDPLDWTQRKIVDRLTAANPLRPGSLAALNVGSDPLAQRYWESADGPAGRGGAVQVVTFEEMQVLVASLEG